MTVSGIFSNPCGASELGISETKRIRTYRGRGTSIERRRVSKGIAVRGDLKRAEMVMEVRSEGAAREAERIQPEAFLRDR